AHQGELVELGFADLGEAARAQGLAGDIGHDARKIADAALAVEDAGFFAAGSAVADELHGRVSFLIILLLARLPSGRGSCVGVASSASPGAAILLFSEIRSPPGTP